MTHDSLQAVSTRACDLATAATPHRSEIGEPYTNIAQQRVLLTLKVLAESKNGGVLPSEVAARVGTIRSNTTRDLANLRTAGLAVTTRGRWYASSMGDIVVR